MENRTLGTSVLDAIMSALERGNSVEVKRNKDGIVVYEVSKKIRQKVPCATGREEGPSGATSSR